MSVEEQPLAPVLATAYRAPVKISPEGRRKLEAHFLPRQHSHTVKRNTCFSLEQSLYRCIIQPKLHNLTRSAGRRCGSCSCRTRLAALLARPEPLGCFSS